LKINFFEGVFMDINKKRLVCAPTSKEGTPKVSGFGYTRHDMDVISHSLRCAASIGLACGQALQWADDEESLRDIESGLEAMALLMKPAAAFLAGITGTARKERKL
jgi:hypothetical protein